MAVFYLRSTDGNNADNGSTWALAKATLAGAEAAVSAGDTIYVSQAHAETGTVALTINFGAGTQALPLKIIGSNDSAAPPTAASTAPSVNMTGTGGSFIIGGIIYMYGVTLNQSSTSVGAILNLGGTKQVFEQCSFILGSALNTSGAIRFPQGPDTALKLRNCSIKFAVASQGLFMGGELHWNGGGVLAGSTTVTTLMSTWWSAAAQTGGAVLIENVDFSNFGTTFNFAVPPPIHYPVIIRNCKLPASWVGGLISTAFTLPGRIEMHNCDSAGTNYKLWIEDNYGQIKDETTIVRTGGASDGVTPLSWKMVSSTVAVYPVGELKSPEFVIYNSATGSSKTLTVEIVRDSLTNLTDKEVWLDVSYLGASGTPLGTSVSDCAASFVVAAADQTASVVTWTTTGLTNPNKQSLSVTFTPQTKGYFLCRVVLAKASTTIYVDPKITVA